MNSTWVNALFIVMMLLTLSEADKHVWCMLFCVFAFRIWNNSKTWMHWFIRTKHVLSFICTWDPRTDQAMHTYMHQCENNMDKTINRASQFSCLHFHVCNGMFVFFSEHALGNAIWCYDFSMSRIFFSGFRYALTSSNRSDKGSNELVATIAWDGQRQ